MIMILSSLLTQLDTCDEVKNFYTSNAIKCCAEEPTHVLPYPLRETFPKEDMATVYHYFDTSQITLSEYQTLVGLTTKVSGNMHINSVALSTPISWVPMESATPAAATAPPSSYSRIYTMTEEALWNMSHGETTSAATGVVQPAWDSEAYVTGAKTTFWNFNWKFGYISVPKSKCARWKTFMEDCNTLWLSKVQDSTWWDKSGLFIPKAWDFNVYCEDRAKGAMEGGVYDDRVYGISPPLPSPPPPSPPSSGVNLYKWNDAGACVTAGSCPFTSTTFETSLGGPLATAMGDSTYKPTPGALLTAAEVQAVAAATFPPSLGTITMALLATYGVVIPLD